jgi:hypothetical protein
MNTTRPASDVSHVSVLPIMCDFPSRPIAHSRIARLRIAARSRRQLADDYWSVWGRRTFGSLSQRVLELAPLRFWIQSR